MSLNDNLQVIFSLFKTIDEFDEVIDGIKYILKPENGELLIKTRNIIIDLYEDIYNCDYKYCDQNILTDEFTDYDQFFLNPKGFRFAYNISILNNVPFDKYDLYVRYHIENILRNIELFLKTNDKATLINILNLIFQFRHIVISYRRYWMNPITLEWYK